MKTLHIIFKVLLSIILIMPIFGAFGVFPAPTAEMYSNPTAFAFIEILMNSKYIMVLDAIVFTLSLFFIWTRREALAGLLLLPITVNIVAFHAFLDGGLLVPGAIMGNVLALLNIYFLWKNRAQIMPLFKKA
jgi:putative oxidoreductase